MINFCVEGMSNARDVNVYNGELNPLILMAEFSKLNVMLSMRLHAAILALNVGVVPIGINYERWLIVYGAMAGR